MNPLFIATIRLVNFGHFSKKSLVKLGNARLFIKYRVSKEDKIAVKFCILDKCISKCSKFGNDANVLFVIMPVVFIKKIEVIDTSFSNLKSIFIGWVSVVPIFAQ